MQRLSDRIATIDCETDPFRHGREPRPFIWGFYSGKHFLTFTDIREMVRFLSERELIVFAHNGGRFDFHYLLDEIPAFTELLLIEHRVVRFKIGRCQFRDSYAMLPIPLKDYKKKKLELHKLEARVRDRHMPEILDYLKHDCIYLYELVTGFINRYGNKPTLAGAAMRTFLDMAPRYQADIRSNAELFKLIRPYYAGGRVQVFNSGIFEGRSRIYDINSAYPRAMLEPHPLDRTMHRRTGTPKKIIGQGFYTIDAESRGALPLRTAEKLEFPEARAIYHVTGWELLAGLKTQTVTVYKHLSRIILYGRINLAPYVRRFWAEKRSAPKGSAEYHFAKLMLNSLYGKFAANPDNYRTYMVIPGEFINLSREVDGFEFEGFIGKDGALVSKPLRAERRFFYNLATGASITGWVRAMLWTEICRLRESGAQVYYCDTDSIITNGEIATGAELGEWSLEQENDRLAIAQRKLYAARKAGSRDWKKASKGVELSVTEIFDVARGATVTYRRDAPTYSPGKPVTFVKRTIKPAD